MNATVYRGFQIRYDPKPIPASCGVDWDWWHPDYAGPGDSRCGNAKSLEAAQQAIDEWYAEHDGPTLETERCAKCGMGSGFAWSEDEQGFVSSCCGWPEKKLPADA